MLTNTYILACSSLQLCRKSCSLYLLSSFCTGIKYTLLAVSKSNHCFFAPLLYSVNNQLMLSTARLQLVCQLNTLRTVFKHWIIYCYGNISQWVCSPWGYLKNKVFQTCLTDLNNLKTENIWINLCHIISHSFSNHSWQNALNS